MAEMKTTKKGKVCVTGGTGFIGSWLVKCLLEAGYTVNITTRINPEHERDISYLTNLPGASERLHVFNADLENPESFAAAIEGCDGVFHTAHPLVFDEKESEETKLKRVIGGMHGILQTCVDSKTVKRVVYTSTISTVIVSRSDTINEDCWSNVDLIRASKGSQGMYAITKTLTEQDAFAFAQKHGLDLVSILPSLTTGPFICAHFPNSVNIAMALILGNEKHYSLLKKTSLVHVDDLARAHIYLFENPNCKGRYLCTGSEFTIEEIREFISAMYPEYEMPSRDSLKGLVPPITMAIPSTKLLESGFKYENGLEEMFDGAIESCKSKGFL